MGRVIQFFRDVKAELWKVVWPTRQQTIQYTIADIVVSVFIAAILGAADLGLLKLFQTILTK